MTTKVVKGSLWTLIGLVVPILVSLFATPINTRLLGAEGYGLLVLVLLIPSYFGFADLGMSIASTKFASGAFAEGATDKEARIVRTAAAIALIPSVPIAAAMIIFSSSIVNVFSVPEGLAAQGSIALKIAGITFVTNFLGLIVNTPQLTRLKMGLNISITSGIRLVGVAATPIVIYLGGGIIGAVVVGLTVSLVTLAAHILFSYRLLPALIGFSIDRPSVRPMMKFGGSLVLASIAAVLLANLEKFVLARVVSVEALAYYSIAATFAAMLTLFSGSIVQSLMPAFSQLQSEANRSALNSLYSRGVRLTLVWLIPGVLFMVLVGRPFFTYWFGPDFGRESTGPFYITLAGLFFNVLAYFPFTAIMAAGRSDMLARIYWAELIPYVFVVWFLANSFGAIGAAAAWSGRVAVDGMLLYWLARKVGVRFDRSHMSPFLAAFAFMWVPIGCLMFFGELNIIVVLSALAFGVVYATIVWKIGLQREEVAWLKNILESYGLIRPQVP